MQSASRDRQTCSRCSVRQLLDDLADAPKPRRARRWGALLVALSIAVIATAASAPYLMKHPAPLGPPDAAPAPTGIMALPLPKSSNPLVVAAYKAGMQNLHDADWNTAAASFHRAAELDPGMAAAHLRVVLADIGLAYDPSGKTLVDAYNHAFSLRADLDERDQGLLDALEPIVRDSFNFVESASRLVRLRDRFPLDAELCGLLANHQTLNGHLDEALENSKKAVELDPTYADAWQLVSANTLATGGGRLEPRIRLAWWGCSRHSPHARRTR